MSHLPGEKRWGTRLRAASVLFPYSFEGPGDYRFEISAHVLEMMQRFRQTEALMSEAGGVLLGRHLRDSSAIIVDEITTPLPGDRCTRTRFCRAQSQHQAVIDEAWHKNNGTCTYLGEWHTHPEPIPSPSVVDWSDWKRRLRSDTYSEPIFFVIVGTKQVVAWEGRHNGVLMLLSIIER